MQILFQKFEEFHHCFQLKRFQQLKILEQEILELLPKKNLNDEESKIIKKIETTGSGSIKIDYEIWKFQIEAGSIKSSKKIFHQICKKLILNKNQEYLELILREAVGFYRTEEFSAYQIELSLSHGDYKKLNDIGSSLEFTVESIEKINANMAYWASLENEILKIYFRMMSGNWASDQWFYKQLLKFSFERLLRKGKDSEIVNFYEPIEVKHKSEHHHHDDDQDLTDEERIENQINFLMKINNLSKALELTNEIKNEKKKKNLKKYIEKIILERNNKTVPEIKSKHKQKSVNDKELTQSLQKLEKVILINHEKDELVTYINFCVYSEFYLEALEKIKVLEKKLVSEEEQIDLKLLKAQIQIKAKLYTDALLELNELLSEYPLKNQEITLSDRLIKKIMQEKD